MRKWPRTDFATVFMHWLAAAAFVWLAATGLRIASDEVGYEWLRVLDAYLPTDQLWRNHVFAGYALTCVAMIYPAYVARSRLSSRVKFDYARLAGLFGSPASRAASLNVLLYWWFFANILITIVTGWLLYAGLGRSALPIHLVSVFALLPFPVLHVLVHGRIGGIRQLARIVRPAPLQKPAPAPDLADLVAELIAQRRSAPASRGGKPSG